MPNVNVVHLIGHCSRDPEVRVFANGGKVTNIGLAVSERKKNQQTGQWEEFPVWLEAKAFNSQNRQLADVCEQYLKKGSPVYIEGRLSQESWDDKQSGQRRTKLVIVVNDVQFLGQRPDGKRQRREEPVSEPEHQPAAADDGDGSIPF